MAESPDYWGDSPALLVVDMTRSLADPAVDSSYPDGVEAADRIRDLLAIARGSGHPVFFSRGGLNYYTSEGADVTDVERIGWRHKHPMREEDPETALLHNTITPALAPNDDEVVIAKSAPSAFFGTMLATYLAQRRVDTLVVTGMVTSACVRASVTDAFSHGYRVVVPRECVADPDPDANERHLLEIDDKYGFVRPVDDVLGLLDRDPGG